MSEKEPVVLNLHERSADVEQFGEIAHERHEAMKNAIDRAERKQKPGHSERKMLAEARKLAEEIEHQDTQSPAHERKRRGPITKKQLNSSFKNQIKSAETDMTTAERITSRFIHIRLIEKTSDVLSNTVARPNALLSGSITAFIGISVIYFVSKYYGFQLTGFETMGAFIAGWSLGLLYDYATVLFRNRR